jgi:DNA-binding MarR family transcriptional regulator
MSKRTPLSYEAAAEFRAALRRYQRRTDEICQQHSLTSEQYTLLLMIKGSPGARSTVGELADRLQLAPNGVTERVRRAEAAGLVRRSVDPRDRRVFWIRSSPKGNRLFTRTFAALGAESQLLFDVVSDVDRVGRRP